jgi:hypothetical protein
MAFTFRPAARENVGLLIGLSGSSGSGKTYTALRLAKGIAGDAPFCVIDTEAGRSRHYSDRFRFDVGDLKPPFTPDAYAEAIAAADAAKYPVIVVDSTSHEWAGEGGILDWQDAELDRMAGTDWKKREACKMAAWIRPKMAHKQMVQKLLQVHAHLILCFRAESKIEMVKNDQGKYEIVEKKSLTGLHGWIPISEKNLPYELTVSFLLMADRPGVPLPIKLQEQHKPLFPLDQVITEESGARLAAWARGSDKGASGQSAGTPGDRPRPPEPTAVDWPARIDAATTPAALKDVVRELEAIKDTLPAETRDTLRAQVKARSAALSRAAKRAASAPTADEIPWTEKGREA